MARGVQLSTLMRVLKDLGTDTKSRKSSTKKSSKLSKKLGSLEITKELRGIRTSIGLLPHSEGSGGGTDE